MKKYLLNISIFLLGVLLILSVYIYSFNLGSLDFYYKRISSPKQHSLILGNSKAAQGLDPAVFNETLNLNNIFNFSFTANYSPYGKVYYNSIKNKLKDTITNGVFILAVDPGSISGDKEDPNDETKFKDYQGFLANIDCFDCNPNYDYIQYSHETFYKKVFLNMVKGRGYLHDNGWLEIKINNDSLNRNKRLLIKLANKNYAMSYTASSTRLEYLKKTINLLKSKGKVYLVRLPTHQKIVERQAISMPQFEQLMIDLSLNMGVPYKSYTTLSSKYHYVDGTHLTNYSAKAISKDIAFWIKNKKQ